MFVLDSDSWLNRGIESSIFSKLSGVLKREPGQVLALSSLQRQR